VSEIRQDTILIGTSETYLTTASLALMMMEGGGIVPTPYAEYDPFGVGQRVSDRNCTTP